MYCLKPPMTQPPEGTTAESHSCRFFILHVPCTVCLRLSTVEGYIWKRVRKTKIAASLCLFLSLHRQLELSLMSGSVKGQGLSIRRSITTIVYIFVHIHVTV